MACSILSQSSTEIKCITEGIGSNEKFSDGQVKVFMKDWEQAACD